MYKMLLLLIAILSFGALAPQAMATSMSQDQVKNMCGSSYGTGVNGEHAGCTKLCHGSTHSFCDYDCTKGKCNGTVIIPLVVGPGQPPLRPGTFAVARLDVIRWCHLTGGVATQFGCQVPCDPFLCKYTCDDKPDCTVAMIQVPVLKPRAPTDTAPTGSLSSFSGGAAPSNPLVP